MDNIQEQIDNHQVDADYNSFVAQWIQTEELCPLAHCRGKLMVATWQDTFDCFRIFKCNTCKFMDQE